MSTTRSATPNYFNAKALSASTVVADTAAISIRYSGHVSFQVKIDNGAGGAPTDTPVGTWEIYTSNDGVTFTQWTNSVVVASLARVGPNGNNVVSGWSVLEGVPGTNFKLRYNRTSGGGTDAKATVHVSTW